MGQLWSIGYDSWKPWKDPQKALEELGGGPERNQFTIQTPPLAAGVSSLLRLGFPSTEEGEFGTALLIYGVSFSKEYEVRIYDNYLLANEDKERDNEDAVPNASIGNSVRYEGTSEGLPVAQDDRSQFVMAQPFPGQDTFFYLRAKNLDDIPQVLDLTILAVLLETSPQVNDYYWNMANPG